MTSHKSRKKPVFIGVSGLRPEVVTALKKFAKQTNRSVSGLVRHIVEQHVANQRGGEA